MIELIYTPNFIKEFKKLEYALGEEVLDKINLYKNRKNHQQLKVHKLHRKLTGRYSFSVNYKTCIVFRYVSKKIAAILSVGDHDVYK